MRTSAGLGRRTNHNQVEHSLLRIMNTLEANLQPDTSIAHTDGREPVASQNDPHYLQACEALVRRDFTTAASEAVASTMVRRYNPTAYFMAGLALLQLELIDDAEQALIEAVRQEPIFPEAHLKLAYIYRKYRMDFFLFGEHRQLAVKAERELRERGETFAFAVA
jgi:tetratricopeptide (TPR) repeat protein